MPNAPGNAPGTLQDGPGGAGRSIGDAGRFASLRATETFPGRNSAGKPFLSLHRTRTAFAASNAFRSRTPVESWPTSAYAAHCARHRAAPAFVSFANRPSSHCAARGREKTARARRAGRTNGARKLPRCQPWIFSPTTPNAKVPKFHPLPPPRTSPFLFFHRTPPQRQPTQATNPPTMSEAYVSQNGVGAPRPVTPRPAVWRKRRARRRPSMAIVVVAASPRDATRSSRGWSFPRGS